MNDATATENGHGADGTWPRSGAGGVRTVAPRPEPMPRRAVASVGFLLDTARRRRSGRIVLWALVVSLALSGVGLLTYPLVTDLWAKRIQNRLEREFLALPATQFRSVADGGALTRLVIPKLHLRWIVVEGTSGNALRAGVGHYLNTALPGDPTGNVAIAGHRTGFGGPFRHLDDMKTGDKLELHTPFGIFVYEVVRPFDGHLNPWVVERTEWSVVAPTAEPMLTLTTCHPPGSADFRLVLRARLVGSRPLEA